MTSAVAVIRSTDSSLWIRPLLAHGTGPALGQDLGLGSLTTSADVDGVGRGMARIREIITTDGSIASARAGAVVALNTFVSIILRGASLLALLSKLGLSTATVASVEGVAIDTTAFGEGGAANGALAIGWALAVVRYSTPTDLGVREDNNWGLSDGMTPV